MTDAYAYQTSHPGEPVGIKPVRQSDRGFIDAMGCQRGWIARGPILARGKIRVVDASAADVQLDAVDLIGGHVIVDLSGANDLVLPPASALLDAVSSGNLVNVPGATAAAEPWFTDDEFYYSYFQFWIHNRDGAAAAATLISSNLVVDDAAASTTMDGTVSIADGASGSFIAILRSPRTPLVAQAANSIQVYQV